MNSGRSIENVEKVIEDRVMRFVYGVVWLVEGVVVYTGSTGRDDAICRTDEHKRLCGGARRLTIAFAQEWHQPTQNSFEFRELWRGVCTLDECRAIEQHFMDKYATRVERRPTNGIARDIDLMCPTTKPLQLNINRACTDHLLVQWAAQRVTHDSAIVVRRTPMELEEMRHALSMARLDVESSVQSVALCEVKRTHSKYAAMPDEQCTSGTDVHADVNRVLCCLTDDDGPHALRCCRGKLHIFNIDHGGALTEWRAAYVAAEFASMLASLGVAHVVPKQVSESALHEDTEPKDPTSIHSQGLNTKAFTRRSWKAWNVSDPVERASKARSNAGQVAMYVDITCPHCGDVFEATAASVAKNKAQVCANHLKNKKCDQPEGLTESESAAWGARLMPPSKRDRSSSD